MHSDRVFCGRRWHLLVDVSGPGKGYGAMSLKDVLLDCLCGVIYAAGWLGL
jgi:hypothetical protein